jgi:hypothetical protein
MDNSTFISIDVEADGPIPGLNAMLSFGAAAFSLRADEPRKPIDTFEANLDLLDHDRWPEHHASPDTMKWWATQSEAWEACRKNTRPPEEVMPEFVQWCRDLPGKLVVVGYPVTFDFMFLYWYTMAFGGLGDGERCPFGFSGLDIKTLAAEKLGVPFRAATKRRMPKRWFKGAPKHDHVALTDAIGQGVLFINMTREGDNP